MAASLRSWWRNCALEADPEILDIDSMEDRIGLISPKISGVRELISTLELCHHKADRWIENIIEAIGSGETRKGLGTRLPGQQHPVEQVWQNACAALSAWCAGCPSNLLDLSIGAIPASSLLTGIGKRSPLKEWQVQRVIDKIRSAIHWPQSCIDPAARYEWILFSGSEYESAYLDSCPDYYKEHESFWLKTVRMIIHDTENGDDAELSLGLAIDMLWPCHWRFAENLQLVLEAIGGRLSPETPFAACGRNIKLLPNRERLEIISQTLRFFCYGGRTDKEMDKRMLALLGKATEVTRWLAASLDKTIRLQLNPPPGVRAVSALAGPEWIKMHEK